MLLALRFPTACAANTLTELNCCRNSMIYFRIYSFILTVYTKFLKMYRFKWIYQKSKNAASCGTSIAARCLWECNEEPCSRLREFLPSRQVYTSFRSVLTVCRRHTAPPNGHISMSVWLVVHEKNKAAHTDLPLSVRQPYCSLDIRLESKNHETSIRLKTSLGGVPEDILALCLPGTPLCKASLECPDILPVRTQVVQSVLSHDMGG